MKPSTLGLVAATALATTATSPATIDSVVTFSLLVYSQGSYEVDGDRETGRVEQVRVSNRTIYQLLADELGESLPPGARIVLRLDGGSEIQTRQGEFWRDTSAYITNFIDTGSSLFNGFYVPSTGQESSIIYLPVTIELNFPTAAVYLEMDGLGTERFYASAPSPFFNNRQVINATISTRVDGTGAVTSSNSFCTGQVNLSGREINESFEDE